MVNRLLAYLNPGLRAPSGSASAGAAASVGGGGPGAGGAAPGGAVLEPLTLHRLDQDTSGVLLFAKARAVVPGVHRQFRQRAVAKAYLAIVAGVPPAGCGLAAAGAPGCAGDCRF